MKATALLAAYLVGAFLTFGHIYNARYLPPKDCGPEPDYASRDWREWNQCQHPRHDTTSDGAAQKASLPAVFWPVYWGARAAIVVTR